MNPVMAGFTEQQAAVLMNNSLSVWKHYDREKSPRDQQHVANVSPGMFSRLADMHSRGKATAIEQPSQWLVQLTACRQ